MKNNKSIIVILLVVFLSLFIILVVLPDSFFDKNKGKGINEITTKNSSEFPFRNLSDMWDILNDGKYSYEYEIMVGANLYNYEGTNSNNELEIDESINKNFLDTLYVNNIIKDIEPKKFNYDDYRMFTYNFKIDDIETEVIIYTDLKSITKIVISNPYYQYNLKYSNIEEK